MKVATNQKFVMYSITYFTIINYIIILVTLYNVTESFYLIEPLVDYFIMGMLPSFAISTAIIRYHKKEYMPFQKTIIRLRVAHTPVSIAFVYCLTLF